MPERVHRRLAAIVAADVVGYSRAIEADEAGTLARLQSVRGKIIDPALERHDGRIVKTIGDGLLIEFPSVIEATQAATEIQSALASRNAGYAESKRILYRVGINIGDVVVENGDLLGDGVNVAARLETLAEPGGICLSESVYEQLRGRLDLPLTDAGPQQLKNITRPVRVFRWRPGAPVGTPARRRYGEMRRRRVVIAATCALALLGVGGSWWYLDRGSREMARAGPSAAREKTFESHGRTGVAVLPFVNLGGDPARDYFSDGLTEEVIGALGHFSAIAVLSRNAVMPYKGKSLPAADTAKALGVRYLVEGTVRQAEARVRVSVQLSDAAAGRLLWSERFDGELRDVMTVQETIARRIVGALAVRLTRAEQERSSKLPTENLEAYDLVLRGRAQLSTLTRRANVEARMLFQRAIALDSRYADAHIGLAHSYRNAVEQGWVPDPREAMTKAEEAAREAIRLDERNSRGPALLARVLAMRQRFDEAKEASRRSLALNPSDAEGYWSLGIAQLYSSEIASAIEAFETARAYDPVIDIDGFSQSLAYYLSDRSQDAIRYVEGRFGRQSLNGYTYLVLSMAYAELGKLDEAKEAAGLARQRNPGIAPEQFGTALRDPKDREKIRAGLQKAGWR